MDSRTVPAATGSAMLMRSPLARERRSPAGFIRPAQPVLAGLPDFHGLLGDGAATACLYAFDLLAVEGEDMRRLPLEARRERLADLLADASPALKLSEHLDGDGALIFAHACRLGLEGLVAKRKGSA